MVPYALHAGLIGNVPLKVFGPKGVIFLTSYAVIVSARSFAAAVTPAAKYFK